MLVVGLTGGIASGKTTVANLFQELGVPVIDTDQLAREAVKPGSIALKKIVEHFGQTILTTDNQLNRRCLRDIIFNQPTEKQWLEQLLHPIIRQAVMSNIEKITTPYCIVVIPLLVENNVNYIDRVLVVDVDEAIQIQRVMTRDDISKDQAQAILNQQATRQQRLAKADDIIQNDNSLAELTKEVQRLHQTYLTHQ